MVLQGIENQSKTDLFELLHWLEEEQAKFCWNDVEYHDYGYASTIVEKELSSRGISEKEIVEGIELFKFMKEISK